MDLFVDFTVKQLILNNIYVGHRQTVASASTFSLLVGNRNGLDFFDIRKIFVRLNPALKFIAHLTTRRGVVLFNNPDRRIMSLFVMQKFSDIVRYFYFTNRKLPGILTNFFRLRSSGFSAKFKTLKRFPAMVFSVSFYDHHIAAEAAVLGLPVLNIYDTNTNFCLNYSYNVPGNDDSFVAHRFYYNTVCRAILKGLVRFIVYRRIRLFKKIKKILQTKKKIKVLGFFQRVSLVVLPILTILQTLASFKASVTILGFTSSGTGFNGHSFSINQRNKNFLLVKNSIKIGRYKKFGQLFANSPADYSQTKYLSLLNGFLNEYDENEKFFSSVRSRRLKSKLKVKQNLVNLLKNRATRLFSFSTAQRSLNRNLYYLNFARVRKFYFFRLVKRFRFFFNIRRVFRLKFKVKGRCVLTFFLFRKLLAKIFYRYVVYLYTRRFLVSNGSPFLYKKLVKQFRRKANKSVKYSKSFGNNQKSNKKHSQKIIYKNSYQSKQQIHFRNSSKSGNSNGLPVQYRPNRFGKK